jgi:tagatose-6-phosphate ketose/aldose isomerase
MWAVRVKVHVTSNDRERTGPIMPLISDGAPRRGAFSALGATREIGTLLGASPEERLVRGYGHTLREICQQPAVWPEAAARVARRSDALATWLAGVDAVVVTGSGSSQYASECIAPSLQARLRLPVTTTPTGTILTHPEVCLPPSDSFLLVSIARSGNSPESRAAVDWLLERRPKVRHLFITCNRDGALATSYTGVPGVESVVLPDEANDESLVMTSSFTSLVVAGLGLGFLDATGAYEARTRGVATVAADVLARHSDALAVAARSGFGSTVFLGSGARLGAAREAALKMLEMNAGKVGTMAESFLGLRHGPMSAVHEDTLLVAFLSSDPLARAYEIDVLRELRRKKLGGRRLIVGAGVPADRDIGPDDLIVDGGSGPPLGDDDLALIDVVVGQMLAFFRCLDSGLRPDSPSNDGVITRVVSSFEIHRR